MQLPAAPSLGPDALKAALNLVSVLAFGGVAVRYAAWMRRDWRALRTMAMGTLPASVAYLMIVGGTERGFYAAARMLDPYGIDLRGYVWVVNGLGVLALAGVALHMVAIWRTDGVAVAPRIIRCGLLLAGLWAVLAWGLW